MISTSFGSQHNHTAKTDKKKVSSRSQARVLAIQYMYQWQINPVEIEQWVQLSPRQPVQYYADVDFARQLIQACVERVEEIDQTYEPYISRGSYHLGDVEKAILRIATGEFLYLPTDTLIVIDEAVKIAKNYASIESYKFINAVLDSLTKQHKQPQAK